MNFFLNERYFERSLSKRLCITKLCISFQTQSFLMDKITKVNGAWNYWPVALQVMKNSFMYLTKFDVVQLPFVLLNVESVERKGKITKIWILWTGRGKLQKFEYLEYKKSFFDEIKNIFYSFWRAIRNSYNIHYFCVHHSLSTSISCMIPALCTWEKQTLSLWEQFWCSNICGTSITFTIHFLHINWLDLELNRYCTNDLNLIVWIDWILYLLQMPIPAELVPLWCVRNSKKCYKTTDQVGLFEKNKRGISSCQFMSCFYISMY